MKDRLLEELLHALPQAFVEELIALQPEVYQQSYQATYQGSVVLADSAAEYLWPHYRRALFETKLLELGGKHGLRAGVEQTIARNHKYTVVKAGRFLMTCSHVSRGYSLQSAAFREQNASLNALLPQLLMEAIIPDAITAPGDLDAVILHCAGWKDKEGQHPGFLKLGIPSVDNASWDQDFDFSEILSAYPQISVPENEQPAIRPQWKIQGKAKEN